MATAEQQEQRLEVRERIVEAARDIVFEHGLDALSMRALAVRIGYSPATIYLYFRDKDELLGSVMEAGFERMGRVMVAERATLEPGAGATAQIAATARAYARFALENTGYFRAMFQLPRVAHVDGCPEPVPGDPASHENAVALLRHASASGELSVPDPDRAAMIGWALMHGLTSLYLSGCLSDQVKSHDEFMGLIDGAIDALIAQWRP